MTSRWLDYFLGGMACARFGYKLPWVAEPTNWTSVGSFLTKIDTENGPALGLVAVSVVRVGDKNLFVVGGERLGKEFLAFAGVSGRECARAALPESGSRISSPRICSDESGAAPATERLAPIISIAFSSRAGQPTDSESKNSAGSAGRAINRSKYHGRRIAPAPKNSTRCHCWEEGRELLGDAR